MNKFFYRGAFAIFALSLAEHIFCSSVYNFYKLGQIELAIQRSSSCVSMYLTWPGSL